MEFKYRDGQIRRTPTPPPRSLSAVAYVSRCPFRGNVRFSSVLENPICGFPSNMLPPRVFPTTVPINAEELRRHLEREQIWRELEKEEIRREIIASEMARRLELEEEVRREMALERATTIPINRQEEITSKDSVINPRMNHVGKINMLGVGGGSPFYLPSLPQNHIKQISMQPQNKEDKVIILAKPDVDSCGIKRKAITPTVDGSEHCSFGLEKKCKKEWDCALCRIKATSEKGLKDHLEGLESRADDQSLQPCITPADTGKLECKEEDQAVLKCKDLGGLDNENETDAGKTNELTTRKRFKFWCAYCQVGTRSEIVMQSHKSGKKHLANINKLNKVAAANP
ncbi:hypothetical protein VNO78_23202 [Psophocarpus tetragonolobus]|uniref:C2H2-type domain-containing protein n=1 Tax=Psophocarpus tetragonolobus TaxID=3891 RepID=A0AAN9S3K3_PSOTE